MSVEQEARELAVERLTTELITWFDNNTGFSTIGFERESVSACYGGHWIEINVDKLARHLITAALLRPSASRDEVLEEAAKVAEGRYENTTLYNAMGRSFGLEAARAIRNLKSGALHGEG